MQGFSADETIAHFKIIVTNLLDLRRIEFLVLDIIEISQKCSDQIKTSISIDCCLEIMKRSLSNDSDKNAINEQDCLLIIKNLFKENQHGQYTILSESLRPMTDFILSSLQKAKESQSARLFDDEILFCVIRITGEQHSFITRMRDKVRRFIDRIMDNTILLKEITANFVNKKPYLKRMIAIVDPYFDYERYERDLLFNLSNFEITKDKHKNLMLWADKYPVNVELKEFKENIQSID